MENPDPGVPHAGCQGCGRRRRKQCLLGPAAFSCSGGATAASSSSSLLFLLLERAPCCPRVLRISLAAQILHLSILRGSRTPQTQMAQLCSPNPASEHPKEHPKELQGSLDPKGSALQPQPLDLSIPRKIPRSSGLLGPPWISLAAPTPGSEHPKELQAALHTPCAAA